MQAQSNAHVDPLFQKILSGTLREHTPPVVDEENCICPHCNGSGEGMSEGSSCWACRGRGDCRGQQ